MNIEKIKSALSGIPFATDEDMENYIALLVIASDIEGHIGSIPLFVIESDGRGCGKTMLAKTALNLAGSDSLLMFPKDEESIMSMMISIIDSNINAYCFDNVKGAIGSEVLSDVIGEELIVRGVSHSVKKLFIMTGNKFTLSEDLERRSVKIRLDRSKIGIGFGYSLNSIAEAVRGE